MHNFFHLSSLSTKNPIPLSNRPNGHPNALHTLAHTLAHHRHIPFSLLLPPPLQSLNLQTPPFQSKVLNFNTPPLTDPQNSKTHYQMHSKLWIHQCFMIHWLGSGPKDQLGRVALLSGILVIMLGLEADGVPPAVQSRTPPPSLMGLPNLPASLEGPLQLTRKGLSVATTSASLTFTLPVASRPGKNWPAPCASKTGTIS
ncbi:hypothetical protein RJ640_016391 [Escallonia rubra]|uniref:Uncharacterized protein n=1 Tax=Escallonia rubra TaxID=112253 RepID=A0AA88UHH8_9ASTE|nr:hypothetical protein RJ640_016391 [Escallonia rubra]